MMITEGLRIYDIRDVSDSILANFILLKVRDDVSVKIKFSSEYMQTSRMRIKIVNMVGVVGNVL